MKQPASFYSSLLWMIFLNVLIKPAWVFGIDRQVQNQVGIEQYGIYFSLFNLSVVFVFLLDWGLTTYFNRQVAMAQPGTSGPSSFLQLKLFFSLAYALVVFTAAWLTHIKRWDIVCYAVLIQVLYHLLLFFRATLTARQFFTIDAWISVIDKSLMLLIAGLLLYSPRFQGSMTIGLFAGLQVACLAVACLVAIVCLREKNLFHYLRFTGFPGMGVFKQAFPFALVILLMSVHSRIDAFLLERISHKGAYETGIYAGAYRLLDAANMVGILTTTFLLPYIVKRWNNKEDIEQVVSTGRNFLLMFAIGVATMIWFLGDWIQQLLYHHQDDQAVTILKWTMPSLIGYALTQVYGTVLTATGHVKSFCRIVAISAVINIALNLILIPRMGAMGCCIAALVSQVGAGIVVTWFACRKMALRIQPRAVFVYIFTFILLGLLLYSGTTIWIMNRFILIVAAIIVTAGIMVISKMINIRKWPAQD